MPTCCISEPRPRRRAGLRPRRFTWVVGLVALGLSGAGAEEVHVCHGSDVASWVASRQASLGVLGSDRHPNLVPDALPGDDCLNFVDFSLDQDGRANDGFHSWVFAAGCKQTLCGEPASFENNVGFFWLSGEHDLNNNIVPRGPFAERVKERACYAENGGGPGPIEAQEQPYLCFNSDTRVHVEITPPRGLRRLLSGLWLEDADSWSSWRRRIAEGAMCVYGPFVGDTGHGVTPEIHPTQLFWWNENPTAERPSLAPDGPYALFLVQDASSRYSKTHHFILRDSPPENGTWRPWAKGPVHGKFEIPFWAGPDGPVRFRLMRYPDNRWKIPAIAAAREVRGSIQDGDRKVDLSITRHEEKLPPSYRFDVRTEVLCKCPDAGCKENGDGPGKPGYLAKLVIEAEVGREREWEEGYLAMLLCDERLGCETQMRIDSPAASPVELGPLRTMVTWAADRGAWVSVAETGAGDSARARTAIDRMFRGAMWPQETAHPYPVLRRLTQATLEARGALPGLTERETGRARYSVEWGRAEACDPDDPASCVALKLRSQRSKAIVDIPATDEIEVRQVKVAVTVHAESEAFRRPGARVLRDGASERRDVWTLWTHGFRAEGEDFWNEAVTGLCRDQIGRKRRQRAAAARTAAEDRARIPTRNLRHLVRRMVGDGVVSVTELSALVKNVGALCGFEPEARPDAPYQRAQ